MAKTMETFVASISSLGYELRWPWPAILSGVVAGELGRETEGLGGGGMDVRLFQELRVASRSFGRGRCRLGRARRARLSRWHSTEHLGGAGRKTTGGGAAGPAVGPLLGRQVSLLPFFCFYFSVICVSY